MDPSELLRSLTPVTQANANMDDPRQHLAWGLGTFPAPNKQMGEVPLQPPVPADLSERLHNLGFRHHPELQQKWIIPGDHPEAGYLNIPRVVDHETYESWLAAQDHPAADEWTETAKSLLGKIDPDALAHIEAMSDEEKAVAREEYRQQMPAAFERLAQLHQDIAETSAEGGTE